MRDTQEDCARGVVTVRLYNNLRDCTFPSYFLVLQYSGRMFTFMTARQYKTAILTVFNANKPRALNKHNLLGKPYAPGDLERQLQVTFTLEERLEALSAFNDLATASYIVPTLADLVLPEDWFVITDSGLEALDQSCFDKLDVALNKLDPHLVEIRDGAWAALNSKRPDSLRQAAHSARELLDQVLKTGAPDDEVRQRSWFVADKSSKTGITRRMRVKVLQEKIRGNISESDTEVFERAAELVSSLSKSLTGEAHSRAVPNENNLKDSIVVAEMAVKRILLTE
jgi:hypothetical protein